STATENQGRWWKEHPTGRRCPDPVPLTPPAFHLNGRRNSNDTGGDKMKRSWLGLAVLALILATLACGKAPQAEKDSAKAAMDDAEASAEKWASSEWQAAQSSMSQAQAEIEAQNQKWFKNYDKAKELLAQAKADAEKAKAAAVTNKETAKNEATA